MNQEHEEGLIDRYLSKINSLCVKAIEGEEVKPQVEAVVKEACEDFATVVTSPANANLRTFRGRLKIKLESASQTEESDILKHAISCCPEKI
ncbi:hypothetical protein [Cobetia crustatorum]|uniref:hypothetical protein n=1 Tax=Cobetia crustatorum TaxID=553385 RepID=UPI0012EBC6B3|nr:hypothetical protein [Cobetia crustatorum]